MAAAAAAATVATAAAAAVTIRDGVRAMARRRVVWCARAGRGATSGQSPRKRKLGGEEGDSCERKGGGGGEAAAREERDRM